MIPNGGLDCLLESFGSAQIISTYQRLLATSAGGGLFPEECFWRRWITPPTYQICDEATKIGNCVYPWYRRTRSTEEWRLEWNVERVARAVCYCY